MNSVPFKPFTIMSMAMQYSYIYLALHEKGCGWIDAYKSVFQHFSSINLKLECLFPKNIMGKSVYLEAVLLMVTLGHAHTMLLGSCLPMWRFPYLDLGESIVGGPTTYIPFHCQGWALGMFSPY